MCIRDRSNIEDIASYLSISTLTVRRDIEEFKANQIIGQKNGNLKLNDDFKLKLKQNKYSRERKAIQKEAAKHVEENDVLFINTSYTALGTVKYIKDIHCTIITNNTNICLLYTSCEASRSPITMIAQDAVFIIPV